MEMDRINFLPLAIGDSLHILIHLSCQVKRRLQWSKNEKKLGLSPGSDALQTL